MDLVLNNNLVCHKTQAKQIILNDPLRPQVTDFVLCSVSFY